MARKPKIIHEDEDILVISKPGHLSVHGDGRSTEYTLADWLLTRDTSLANVGEPLVLQDGKKVVKPGLVHRLDRDTSGVMIIAKHRLAYNKLKNQFKKRKVEKWYHAIVYGKITKRFFEVEDPIGRSSRNFKRRTTKQDQMRGRKRDAHTKFWVLEARNDASLLRVKPLTGRTHQIRVHCASVRHPIVCDNLYASHRECLFGFTRAGLHAASITFIHPGTNEEVTFEASYPPDFEKALTEFRKGS